jgi:hypothetical protein
MWDMDTPGFPPTRLTAVLDRWVRPTRRPADLTVGPTDLVGGPHDLLKTFQKIPQATLSRTTSKLGEQDKIIVDSDKAGRRIWQVLFRLRSHGRNWPGVWEPTLSAGQYKADRASPCNNTQSSSNPRCQLDVGFYSPEAWTSIKFGAFSVYRVLVRNLRVLSPRFHLAE